MEINASLIEKAKEMKRKGYTNSKIANALGIGKRTVVRYTAWLGPRSFMGVRRPLPPYASEMTVAKAGIHAYLVAEGNKKASRPRRDNNYRRVVLGFWNTCPVLLRDFADHVKRVYDYQPWIDYKRGRVEVKRVAVVNDLLKYGPYDSYNWSIPFEVMNGDFDVKREWIRCFGDGEGHVSKSKKEITFKSVNVSGLKKIKFLLFRLGIASRINGPYDGAYVLTISRFSNLRRYRKIVGFINPNRREGLARLFNERFDLDKSIECITYDSDRALTLRNPKKIIRI